MQPNETQRTIPNPNNNRYFTNHIVKHHRYSDGIGLRNPASPRDSLSKSASTLIVTRLHDKHNNWVPFQTDTALLTQLAYGAPGM